MLLDAYCSAEFLNTSTTSFPPIGFYNSFFNQQVLMVDGNGLLHPRGKYFLHAFPYMLFLPKRYA